VDAILRTPLRASVFQAGSNSIPSGRPKSLLERGNGGSAETRDRGVRHLLARKQRTTDHEDTDGVAGSLAAQRAFDDETGGVPEVPRPVGGAVQLDEATLSDVLDFVADGTTPSIRRRRARATLARVTIKVPRRPPTDRVVYADDTWGCLCREHGYAGTWDDVRRALHPARGVPGSGIRPGAFVAFVMCG